MTCRAIRHDTKEESIPLLLVRRGELTPRQCDHEFKGLTGDCPTCKAQSDAADVDDGGSYAKAILLMRDRGFGVSYKRFGYGSDGGVEPWRVCYWGHPPGYWTDIPFKNCQSPDTDSHTIALQIIREHYAKQFKPEMGFVIKTEPKLRKPGDPPRPYSPDLAIYGPNDQRMVAVEYQRSHEAYEKFADRDELRRSEGWAAVDWWLDDTQPDPESLRKTVYDKSQQHRTHLALLGVPLYRCWVDPQTLKLQAEPGRCGDLPPDRRKRIERHIEKAQPKECSTAKLIRELEGAPEELIIKDYKKPLRPNRGTELEFFQDVTYSIERERRLALAVTKKQKRLEEQDRRHREYETKLRIHSRINALLIEFSVLKLSSNATLLWTVQRLEQELSEIEAQRPRAKEAWARLHKEAADAANAAKRKAEDLRVAQLQTQCLETKRGSDLDKMLAMLRGKPQKGEQWQPIEFWGDSVPKLLPGSRIRKGSSHPVEIYKGFSRAGYSTNQATYKSLWNWQVFKSQNKS